MNQVEIAEEHIHEAIIALIQKHFFCSRWKAKRVEPSIYQVLLTISDPEDLKDTIVYELLMKLAGTEDAKECADEIIALNFSPAEMSEEEQSKLGVAGNMGINAFVKILARASETSRKIGLKRGLVEDIGDVENEESNNKVLKITDGEYAFLYNKGGHVFTPEQMVTITRTRMSINNKKLQTKIFWTKTFFKFYIVYLLAHPLAFIVSKFTHGSVEMAEQMKANAGTPTDYFLIAIITIIALYLFRRCFAAPAHMILFAKGTFYLRNFEDRELNGVQVIKFKAGDDVDVFLHKRLDVNGVADQTILMGALEAFSTTQNPSIDKMMRKDDVDVLEPNEPLLEVANDSTEDVKETIIDYAEDGVVNTDVRNAPNDILEEEILMRTVGFPDDSSQEIVDPTNGSTSIFKDSSIEEESK